MRKGETFGLDTEAAIVCLTDATREALQCKINFCLTAMNSTF